MFDSLPPPPPHTHFRLASDVNHSENIFVHDKFLLILFNLNRFSDTLFKFWKTVLIFWQCVRI